MFFIDDFRICFGEIVTRNKVEKWYLTYRAILHTKQEAAIKSSKT